MKNLRYLKDPKFTFLKGSRKVIKNTLRSIKFVYCFNKMPYHSWVSSEPNKLKFKRQEIGLTNFVDSCRIGKTYSDKTKKDKKEKTRHTRQKSAKPSFSR